MSMNHAERASITEKAMKMAKMDKEINGSYVNAPYTITHLEGQYKARLHYHRDGENTDIHLVVEQPVRIIGQEFLSSDKPVNKK
jgi:hypothetical protein